MLSQCHYIEKILNKFDKNENNIAKILVDVNLYLSKNTSDAISKVEYLCIIESLMYLIKDIRLGMACTFNKLNRYTSNHIKDHWKTIVRILKNLRCILKYGLYYTRYSIISKGYNDNNWICNIKDSKFISGFIFIIEKTIIS